MVLLLKSKGIATAFGEGTSLVLWRRNLGIDRSVSILWPRPSHFLSSSSDFSPPQMLIRVPQSSILSCKSLLFKKRLENRCVMDLLQINPSVSFTLQILNSSWARNNILGTLCITSGRWSNRGSLPHFLTNYEHESQL